MLTRALSRTRRPIGGRFGPLHVDASWRAGYTYRAAVHGAVKRSAWSIPPAATSLYRASPGRIGRPAASAEVQVAGRRWFERRLKIAPEPALQRSPWSCG